MCVQVIGNIYADILLLRSGLRVEWVLTRFLHTLVWLVWLEYICKIAICFTLVVRAEQGQKSIED